MTPLIATFLKRLRRHALILTLSFLGLAMIPVHAQDSERDQMTLIPGLASEHLREPLTTAQELIVDGDFEGGYYNSSWGSATSGVTGPWRWTNSRSTLNPINSTNSSYTHSGSYMVYFPLGGPIYGTTDSQIYQQVTIPSDVTATLSFWTRLSGASGLCIACTGGYSSDSLTVNFTDLNGYPIPGFLKSYSDSDSAGFTWVKHTYDVSAFAGQSVFLLFSTHNVGATVFMIDDVSLSTLPAGPPPTTLNLQKGRVEVSVEWKSQYDTTKTTNTAAFPLPQNDNFAYFYFTDSANPEVFLKVLDFGGGGPLCFVGSLTDFYVKVTFKIIRTGQTLVFEKRAGEYVGFVDNGTLKF